ncbi:MAG: MoaD/ThiS family protein [Chloroflexota bacterium]
MGKVKLTIPLWVATSWKLNIDGGLTWEKSINGMATVGELLADLVKTYPRLRDLVFDPASGEVNNGVHLFLNNTYLPHPNEPKAKLKDGDSILILPVHMGG